MKYICLINNFNYGGYLEEAIISALRQDFPFDHIIIIDDGSTDNSIEILKKYEGQNNIRIICKENEGQMSVFNLIPEIITDNSRVFFLDSDDIYPRDYLKNVVKITSDKKMNNIDCTICDYKIFSDVQNILETSLPYSKPELIFFKYTSCLTRELRICLGAPTSCLSFSGQFLHKILPYPYQEDWKVEADLVLLNAASILNAERLYIKNLFINYRLHDRNAILGKQESVHRLQEKQLKIERLFNYYIMKFQLFDKCKKKEILRDLYAIEKIKHINYLGASKLEKFYMKFLYVISKILFKFR